MKNIYKKLIIWIIKQFSFEEKLASLNKIINHRKDNNKIQTILGYFTDYHGKKYKLIEGLRDEIKPNWESASKKKNYKNNISNEAVKDQLNNSKSQLDMLERLISIHSIKINPEMDILEIGAANGAGTFQIASKKPKSIIGSDIVEYQINQTVNAHIDKKSKELERECYDLSRQKVGSFFNKEILNIVSFLEDDICQSKIKSNSKDLIFSWDTLEHLSNPQNAFKEMFRILKPGGFTFHQYNPFFSLNGGHSLCTLDFLWGHVRLSSSDFENYLKQFRPNEYEVALSFYKNNLNRMTINQLKKYISLAGFEFVTFFPNVNFENYYMVTEKIYADCKHNYPLLELIDLVSPEIWIGLKKPFI